MVHERTAAHFFDANGVAQRMNQTLLSLVRAMLRHKNLPKVFWAEAFGTALSVRSSVARGHGLEV